MRQTINDTQGAERLRTGLYAGAATVGRPSGVDGKNRVPRRPKMTAKETAKLNLKHFPDEIKKPLKAGGPGSGRHKEAGTFNVDSRQGSNKEGMYTIYKSDAGTKMHVYHKAGDAKDERDNYADVYGPKSKSKPERSGSFEDIGSYLKSKYGIDHKFNSRM